MTESLPIASRAQAISVLVNFDVFAGMCVLVQSSLPLMMTFCRGFVTVTVSPFGHAFGSDEMCCQSTTRLFLLHVAV